MSESSCPKCGRLALRATFRSWYASFYKRRYLSRQDLIDQFIVRWLQRIYEYDPFQFESVLKVFADQMPA